MPGYPIDYPQAPMARERSPDQELSDSRSYRAILCPLRLEKASFLTTDYLLSATDRKRTSTTSTDASAQELDSLFPSLALSWAPRNRLDSFNNFLRMHVQANSARLNWEGPLPIYVVEHIHDSILLDVARAYFKHLNEGLCWYHEFIS